MGMLGSSVAQSIAGLPQSERIAIREAERTKRIARPKGKQPEAEVDEVELSVSEIEAAEGARAPTGNDREETHAEREARAQAAKRDGEQKRPSVDVQA